MQCAERTSFSLISQVNWGTWLLGRAAKQSHNDVYGMFVDQCLSENYSSTCAPLPFFLIMPITFYICPPSQFLKIPDFVPNHWNLEKVPEQQREHGLSLFLTEICLSKWWLFKALKSFVFTFLSEQYIKEVQGEKYIKYVHWEMLNFRRYDILRQQVPR